MKPLDEPILCRASTAVALPATLTGEMMYMPGGRQVIKPVKGMKKGQASVTVDIRSESATALESQRQELVRRGKRPFFDFNHEGGSASFWPDRFFWRNGEEPGIYCAGEWTASGKAGVEGKEWRAFSPVFHVDNKTADPARVICQPLASPNMGGLVNNPAFGEMQPFWSAEEERVEDADEDESMTTKELAELRAKVKSLETQHSALVAKNAEAAALSAARSELALAQSELRAAELEIENEAIKAKQESAENALRGRLKADAQAAVKAAVGRGAIPAKDQKSQDALVAKATDDPEMLTVIAAMQGSPALGGRITASRVDPDLSAPGSRIVVARESAHAVVIELGRLLRANKSFDHRDSSQREQKRSAAREMAALFAAELDPAARESRVILDMSVTEMYRALQAADNTDVSVGTLSGTLVLQRALPLMMYDYPILSGISQDFSDAPGLLNQTEVTRIILTPAVQTWDPTTDSAGRPKGWDTVSPAQTVDVPVKLTDYVGVPTVFGEAELASTTRNLFAEQAPKAVYALGGYAVSKLAGLMTAANFNAYAGTTASAGATTSGSNTITMTSTANLYPGAYISGTGIPTNTYVSSVATDGVTATITQNATATNTGLTFTISNSKVPNTYTTYAKAQTDFSMASLADIGAAFDTNEVPMADRSVLLNAQYYRQLSQDTAFNTFYAATRAPQIISEGRLPRLQGIEPMNAPWFPTANYGVGFAMHKAALVLKTRLPNDFTKATGAMIPGSVTMITIPGGISVLLVEYVNLTSNYCEWRPEMLIGYAAGERRAGMLITSQ